MPKGKSFTPESIEDQLKGLKDENGGEAPKSKSTSEKIKDAAKSVLGSKEEKKAEAKAKTETPAEPEAEAKPAEPSEVPTTEPTDPQPEVALPPELIERSQMLKELIEETQREIEAFKSQGYLDGDVPVYLPLRTGMGMGPTDRSIGWIDPKHLDPRYAFRWCNKKKVDQHRAKGRDVVPHKVFQQMTIARGGRYSYGSSAEGHVVCGDLILMYTSKEHQEALNEAVRKRTARGESRAKGVLRAKGKELDVEVTAEDDVGPKVKALIAQAVKELGPDALRIFQR